jgi:hypothetical protein
VTPRPLANRVDPFGNLFATPERGALLGNRGGRFHDPASQAVRGRPWASRQWICCVLAFKDRRRKVWGSGYTELFFADEAAALAAGHRPCFECRRADATALATAWGRAQGIPPPRAPEMDAALHAERLDARRGKRLHGMALKDVPDGAMVVLDGRSHLVRGDALLPWSFGGYGAAVKRPAAGSIQVLTPPSIVAAIKAGYVPLELRSQG